MKKISSLILVIVLVLGLSALVLAHGNNNGRNYNNNRRYYRQNNNYDNGRNYNQLNLSEEQLDDLDELEEKYEDELDDLRDDLWDKQEDLRDLYIDKSSKKDEIIKLSKQLNQLRDKLADLTTDYKLELRELLTAEQLEQMSNYRMMEFGLYNCGMGGYGPRGNRGYGSRMRGRGRGAHNGFGPSMMH